MKNQKSLFDADDNNTPWALDMPNADVVYHPSVFSDGEADTWMQTLYRQLAWRQDHIKMYGKRIPIPRLQAWYGDQGTAYQYSGLTMQPHPWIPALLTLKGMSEDLADTSFNSVLANLYRDGNDGVGKHADNEPELGQNPIIASFSFGASRNLDFYHNKQSIKRRVCLNAGSLLVMKGETQHYWQHCVAKTKKVSEPRINLTFRYVKRT
jgi:alkylated DNA repair dioxygenase AlkB